jgi:hypothetical protein
MRTLTIFDEEGRISHPTQKKFKRLASQRRLMFLDNNLFALYKKPIYPARRKTEVKEE